MKRSWNELKQDEPGQRFQNRHARRQEGRSQAWTWRRVAKVGLGVGLILVGLLMVPLPGPGWIIVFIGFGMLGNEFAPVARFLDRAEVWLRAVYDGFWGKAGVAQRAALVLVLLVVTAGLCYLAYPWLVDRLGLG